MEGKREKEGVREVRRVSKTEIERDSKEERGWILTESERQRKREGGREPDREIERKMGRY